MDLQKFGIKLFIKKDSTYSPKDFIPVFHNWIQNSSLPEHLLIDVVDYSHIYDGPGVLLTAHEGHISLDNENDISGLFYLRKTNLEGNFAKRFKSVLSISLFLADLFQKTEYFIPIEFSANSFRFIANDRLLAVNNDKNKLMLSDEVKSALANIYPKVNWILDDYSENGERLAFTVKLEDSKGSIFN